MVTFLTVLKSRKQEDDYGMHVGYSIYYPEYVYALQKQIEKYYPHPHRFICLTDFEDMNCETISLGDNLPGWWSKIELFKIQGDRFIYFDLDTFIISDITELIEYPHTMSALHEISSRKIIPRRFASGIMAWSGDHKEVYRKFMEDPLGNMQKYKKGGDQHFLNEFYPDFKSISEITSGIINYKFELRDKENLPKGAKIIYFHAQHKPWRLNHKWLDQDLYNRQ